MTKTFKYLETKVVHAGEPDPRIDGAVAMPIFQSATFEYGGEASYHDVRYVRLNNTPNHRVLHQKLAALENAESAVVASSGMAAITTALLTVLNAGDHLLVQDCLYGGTRDFITGDLPLMGISYDFINVDDPDTWRSKLRTNTKAIYVEAISNPLIEVGELKSVVDFARASGLVSMIDNTFASPINFRPPELGFDLSLHSGTKYLNGHSDVAAGACIGRVDLIERILHKLNHLGGTLDPHACFLLHRGIKTLALRVRHQNASAMRIAEFLENHPRVRKVNYPGLESSASHKRARSFFDGFGGMISFEIDGALDRTNRFLERVTIPIVAPSLGGAETLVTLPSTTSHVGMPSEQRQALGISDNLIRVSVGLESSDELIEDFDAALAD